MLAAWVTLSTLALVKCQSSSFSSSVSVPGHAPVTYTATTGLGTATAFGASNVPVYQYRPTYTVRPKREVETSTGSTSQPVPVLNISSRSDANQQIIQKAAPQGLMVGGHPSSAASPQIPLQVAATGVPRSRRDLYRYFYSPPVYSGNRYVGARYYYAPAVSVASALGQAGQAFAPPHPSAPAPVYGLPVASAASALAPPPAPPPPPSSPSPVYGLPVGSAAAALAQAGHAFALAPPSAPVPVYGLPVKEVGSFAGALAETEDSASPPILVYEHSKEESPDIAAILIDAGAEFAPPPPEKEDGDEAAPPAPEGEGGFPGSEAAPPPPEESFIPASPPPQEGVSLGAVLANSAGDFAPPPPGAIYAPPGVLVEAGAFGAPPPPPPQIYGLPQIVLNKKASKQTAQLRIVPLKSLRLKDIEKKLVFVPAVAAKAATPDS